TDDVPSCNPTIDEPAQPTDGFSITIDLTGSHSHAGIINDQGVTVNATDYDNNAARIHIDGDGAGVWSDDESTSYPNVVNGEDGRLQEINYSDAKNGSESLIFDLGKNVATSVDVKLSQFYSGEGEKGIALFYLNGVEVASRPFTAGQDTGNQAQQFDLSGIVFDRMVIKAVDHTVGSTTDNSDFHVKEVRFTGPDVIGQVSGNINAEYGADGSGSIALNSTQTETITLADGTAVNLVVDGNKITGIYDATPEDGNNSQDGLAFVLNLDEATGEYSFVQYQELNHDADGMQFGYTITDSDSDSSSCALTIATHQTLLVGSDVDDAGLPNAAGPQWVVGEKSNGESSGDIEGAVKAVIAGDAGDSSTIPVTHDYNFALMLDTSGSMDKSDLEDMVEAVSNLLTSIRNQNYKGGVVKVHIVDFDTNAVSLGTFTINGSNPNAAGGYKAALDTLATMDDVEGDNYYGGSTNYEAAMDKAIAWLPNPNSNVTNYSYFITDGAPNKALDKDGSLTPFIRSEQAMEHIRGKAQDDQRNEIEKLQQLSLVVAVGIGVSAGTNKAGYLNEIDSKSDAILLTDTSGLNQALQQIPPLINISPVGDDHIEGSSRSDIIYGDVLNTDLLADDKGINLPEGSGWSVFEHLEDNDPDWSRQDTIDYINTHKQEIAAETVASGGARREGGDDEINGGAGDDYIFGQEGNDVIDGGSGNDYIRGGSGDDQLIGGSGKDTFAWHVADLVDLGMLNNHQYTQRDEIKDFQLADGAGSGDRLDFSNLLEAPQTGFTLQDLENLLGISFTNGGADTTISYTHTVPVSNSSNVDTFTLNIVLEGVAQNEWNDPGSDGVDQTDVLTQLINSGQLIV
ncbi:VWA domain-containing protein, partial [Sansalvadorimonas sp. 2012CJ34-2]